LPRIPPSRPPLSPKLITERRFRHRAAYWPICSLLHHHKCSIARVDALPSPHLLPLSRSRLWPCAALLRPHSHLQLGPATLLRRFMMRPCWVSFLLSPARLRSLLVPHTLIVSQTVTRFLNGPRGCVFLHLIRESRQHSGVDTSGSGPMSNGRVTRPLTIVLTVRRPPPHSSGLRHCHFRVARHGPSLFRGSPRERRHCTRFHLRRYLKWTGALALAACRRIDRVAPLQGK